KRWLVDRSLLDDSTATIDVFSYKTRFFKTASKTSGLTFPDKDFEETKYGVSVGDTVYFFTPQGEEAE
ncbi:MAG: hypothetical protein KDA58_10850, partial [Planctomycetaceae bacterium]|nr:hypothetical protein [Planctomycetaceae bacterium]